MTDPNIDASEHGILGRNPKRELIREKRNRRRRDTALFGGVLVLALIAWLGVVLWQDHQRRCLGLDDTQSSEFELSRINGECIGWTAERNYAFSPDIADIVGRITAENRAVRERFEHPVNGRGPVPYVRVAAFMPMTADDTSAMTKDTIRHALEGLYSAQARANDLNKADFRDPTSMGVQLLLVNEGRLQDRWQRTTEQLGRLTGGAHPVVAAVGMGVSVPETIEAATTLADKKIPSIGAVITATDMLSKNFIKVSPSNLDYAKALAEHIRTRPDLATGYLVFDSNNDNYTRTLREAFEQTFGQRFQLDKRRSSFAGTKKPNVATPLLFGRAVDNICQTRADVVFYAGRDRDIDALIRSLAKRGQCGHDKSITVVAGSTGLRDLTTNDKLRELLSTGGISVLDATAADDRAWSRGAGAPKGYRDFETHFRGVAGVAELTDGYAIMHHDALATAVWATRLTAAEMPGQIPTGSDVALSLANLNGTKPVPGASGDLAFDDSPGGWPRGKLVPLVGVPTTPAGLGPTYVTS